MNEDEFRAVRDIPERTAQLACQADDFVREFAPQLHAIRQKAVLGDQRTEMRGRICEQRPYEDHDDSGRYFRAAICMGRWNKGTRNNSTPHGFGAFVGDTDDETDDTAWFVPYEKFDPTLKAKILPHLRELWDQLRDRIDPIANEIRTTD